MELSPGTEYPYASLLSLDVTDNTLDYCTDAYCDMPNAHTCFSSMKLCRMHVMHCVSTAVGQGVRKETEERSPDSTLLGTIIILNLKRTKIRLRLSRHIRLQTDLYLSFKTFHLEQPFYFPSYSNTDLIPTNPSQPWFGKTSGTQSSHITLTLTVHTNAHTHTRHSHARFLDIRSPLKIYQKLIAAMVTAQEEKICLALSIQSIYIPSLSTTSLIPFIRVT